MHHGKLFVDTHVLYYVYLINLKGLSNEILVKMANALRAIMAESSNDNNQYWGAWVHNLFIACYNIM